MMSGVIGVHPAPFSFWELATMQEGKEREAWDRIAIQTSALVNCHVKTPIHFSKFHKYLMHEVNNNKLTVANMGRLKSLFKPQKENQNG